MRAFQQRSQPAPRLVPARLGPHAPLCPRRRVSFQVGDALAQPFPDGSFDLVWSMESGEHMPEKPRWVRAQAVCISCRAVGWAVGLCFCWAPLALAYCGLLRCHSCAPRWACMGQAGCSHCAARSDCAMEQGRVAACAP